MHYALKNIIGHITDIRATSNPQISLCGYNLEVASELLEMAIKLRHLEVVVKALVIDGNPKRAITLNDAKQINKISRDILAEEIYEEWRDTFQKLAT